MNAIEVIKMGRNRNRQASKVASITLRPASFKVRANSMIKMAFFEDKPMMAISPTLKNTSSGRPRIITASTAPKRPKGTTNMTAKGIDQLSYSAASAKNTTKMEMANRAGAWLPESRSSKEVLDHSKPMPGGSFWANSSIALMASPELLPGAGEPEILTEGRPL